jgi:hypothetical protein
LSTWPAAEVDLGQGERTVVDDVRNPLFPAKQNDASDKANDPTLRDLGKIEPRLAGT